MKLLRFALAWAGMVIVKIPVALLGAVVIPVVYLFRHRPQDEVPRILLPWLNPEDSKGGPEHYAGGLPRWWVSREGVGFWSYYKYHAIRNPANGLRNFEWLDLDLDKTKIEYHTPKYLRYYEPWHMRPQNVKSAWYLCWQGKWKAGVKYVRIWNEERHFVFKWGWRVEPRDAIEGPDPDGQRAIEGAGFASKLLPYRRG